MKKHMLEITAIGISICSIFISMQNLRNEIPIQKQSLPKTMKYYNAKQIQELSKIDKKLNKIGISKEKAIAVLKNIDFN